MARSRTARRPAALSDAEVDRIAARLRAPVAEKLIVPSAERAAGRTYTTDQVVAALAQAIGAGGNFRPMPRDPRDDVPFGPLRPLVPDPFDPARPDTGRPDPRLSEYPTAWNVPGSGSRLIAWNTLRMAAREVDVMRRCIEIRKARVCGMGWSWKVRPEIVEAAYRADGSRGHDDIAAELRDEWATEINRLTAFWANPWRSQGLDFATWMRGVMEERLVLDALVLYPQTTYGGDLLGLEIIDGSTVKPLLDYRGARPMPPFPAYQQEVYGFPRGEWAATTVTDDEGRTIVGSGFLAGQLIYVRENYRSFTPYGFSPTEQALVSARLYLKRQGWMFAEYDEGALGEAYAISPETSPMTPLERREWERSLNDEMGGQTAARHRIKALFPGMTLAFPPDNAERYKPEYDLFLIKLLSSHFGVPVSELGFTETRGLGGAGMHESMKKSQDDSSTQPDIAFMEALVNVTSADFMRAPAELVFGFNDPDGESEKDADDVAKSRIERGSVTLNEDRTRLGLPRYTFPEADKPFVMGAGGPVYLEGSAEAQAQANIQHNFDPRAARSPDGPQPGDNPGDNPASSGPARSQASKAAGPDDAGFRAAEVAAYRKFAKRAHSRPFAWTHHTPDEVAELTKAAPPGKSEPAPGEVPPAPDTRWPGWAVDLALAAIVAAKLRAALAPLSGLAARVRAWAAGGAPTSTPGVTSWLKSESVDREIAGAIDGPVRDAVTEGYAAGARSAQHVIAVGFEGTVDWGGWKPGNVAAARRVLSEDGMTVGLQQLLDDAGATVSRIAAGRLDEVAAVLADGLERGAGVDEIATALRGVLDDRKWAEMTAWTETNRAMSAAAMDTYREAGIEGKAWFTAADQRVCPICKANEDQGAVALGAPFVSGDEHPPGHPRCVIGSTRVRASGEIFAATDRHYVGEAVVIRTARGHELTATPNHPIATRDGWIPIAELRVGGHVLSSTDAEWIAQSVDPDVDHVPPRIEDVAKALPVLLGPVPTAAQDFHGDGAGSEVHVVLSDRLLVADGKIQRPEHVGEQEFGSTDVAGSPPLSGKRPADERFVRLDDTPDGGVGGGGEPPALGLIGGGHPYVHGRTPPPDFDAGRFQASADLPPVDSEGFCERLFAGSADVALDQIVHVERSIVSTHVYNLETGDGWYIGNGIVTHNCRCSVVPEDLPPAEGHPPPAAVPVAGRAPFSPLALDEASGIAYVKAHGTPLDEARAKAVRHYTDGGGYAAVNRSLRAGRRTPESDLIDSAMAPTADDLSAHRSVGSDAFTPDPRKLDDVMADLAGRVIRDPAFASTSLNPPVSASAVTMHLSLPKGTPAVIPGSVSEFPSEAEVLLGRGQGFAVTRVLRHDNGTYEVWADAVPEGTGT